MATIWIPEAPFFFGILGFLVFLPFWVFYFILPLEKEGRGKGNGETGEKRVQGEMKDKRFGNSFQKRSSAIKAKGGHFPCRKYSFLPAIFPLVRRWQPCPIKPAQSESQQSFKSLYKVSTL